MSLKEKIITLSAIGVDTTGLVSKITTKIHELGGNIIDVEENCRRGLFSIFLIIDFSNSDQSIDDISLNLKSLEKTTGLKIIISFHDLTELSYQSEQENHIVTILGIDQPGLIAKVSTFFKNKKINIESCKMIARGKFFSMEMIIDTSKMQIPDSASRSKAIEIMKKELRELCTSLDQSVVIQSENIYMKVKKLIVFDVETSLIQPASLKAFISRIGDVVPELDAACRNHENGKQEDELQQLIENARLLKGIPISDMEKLAKHLQLNPGAIELIKILKSMGFKIALLSSGFSFFIKKIFEAAGVDYAFSNTLKVGEDGLITGELEEPIITNKTKNEILEFMMNIENISRDQVIAVGDGSINAHFMKNVGLSLAFKPNSKDVHSDGIFSNDQIINLLYCLGIPKSELDKYLEGKNDEQR
ncbi:MAG: HAD-IB family phosphatase [Promethearchaeota archaeon]